MTLPETLTKQTILSTIAKLWDPLEILAAVTLSLRILMQSLWSVQLSWDDPVDCTTRTEIKKRLQDFWIDHCIKPNCNSGPFELHGFCDAGEKAYGAMVWMRCLTSGDQCFLRFVVAKSFVAPVKKRSIPRLELMAAVILSRLVTSIHEVLSFNSITLWWDSAVVLHWLNNPASKFKPFVSTRVQEIQETLSKFSNCFCYIRSCNNPADFLTKPIIFDKLSP